MTDLVVFCLVAVSGIVHILGSDPCSHRYIIDAVKQLTMYGWLLDQSVNHQSILQGQLGICVCCGVHRVHRQLEFKGNLAQFHYTGEQARLAQLTSPCSRR